MPAIGRCYRPTFEVLEDRCLPAIFFVTSTFDALVDGSLRAAITDANLTAGNDVILFTIGNGLQTIDVGSQTGLPLPAITDPVVIDARPNDLFPVQVIELNGTQAGANANGLTVEADCTIRGLTINRFTSNGIAVIDGNARIEGNLIGVDSTGTLARPNWLHGVAVTNTGGAVIGGTTAEARNIISGNLVHGIWLDTESNAVTGNYIGTDKTGTQLNGNGGNGVHITSSFNTIGGVEEGARNIISGNHHGIFVLQEQGLGIVEGNDIYQQLHRLRQKRNQQTSKCLRHLDRTRD